jgi:hypothetical protein
MKQTVFYFFSVPIVIFLCFIIISSCSKEKQILQNTVWQIESLRVHTDSAWINCKEGDPGEEHNHRLTFEEENKYYFDRNIGKVKIMANQKIKFEGTGWSGSYCDLDCNRILNKSTHYELLENLFILKGENGSIMNFIKIE